MKKPVKKSEAKFEYRTECCNVAAKKPALVRQETGEKAKSPELGPGLGKWVCPTCRKKAKVSRRKPESADKAA